MIKKLWAVVLIYQRVSGNSMASVTVQWVGVATDGPSALGCAIEKNKSNESVQGYSLWSHLVTEIPRDFVENYLANS